MEAVKKLQAQLLAQAPFLRADNDYHQKIKAAFLQTPRHLFIKKFKDLPASPWTTVTADNLESLLPLLYANRPLFLYHEHDNEQVSTISQPYIVLQMLDLLQLQEGHTVFEVGAASGWNAALMAALTGETGHVYSAEIIPSVAEQATQNIDSLQIRNVTILQSDAGVGYAAKAPFDRIVFTASACDLPACFFEQLKEDGILLMVLTVAGGGDVLLQLKKAGDHLEAAQVIKCQFVKMTGQYYASDRNVVSLEELPEWQHLKDKEAGSMPFWWGALAFPALPFSFKTAAFRFYLGLADAGMRVIKGEQHVQELLYFGLLNPAGNSFTMARENALVTFGNNESKELLLQHLHNWVNLGMPDAGNYSLKIYPKGIAIPAAERQWIVERTDATFVWSL
jgi:protein-L-isoaspartate(D-aspartate) O-methyltransferase